LAQGAKLPAVNIAVYAEGKQDWMEAGLSVQSGPMLRRRYKEPPIPNREGACSPGFS